MEEAQVEFVPLDFGRHFFLACCLVILVGSAFLVFKYFLSHLRSIIGFLICIMAFMWRSGTNPPPEFFVSPNVELAFRVFVSVVLGIGIFYGILILLFFRHHRTRMEKKLAERSANSAEPPAT